MKQQTENATLEQFYAGAANILCPSSAENVHRAGRSSESELLQAVLRKQEEFMHTLNQILSISAKRPADSTEGEWLDRAKAEKYLSMSRNTFEKYANSEGHSIPKSLVGGKNYYRKKDLDLFVMTWKDKSLGYC